MHYLIKSFIIWLLFIPLAVANGALRDLVLIPALGETAGRAVSSLALSLLILGLTLLLVRRLGDLTRAGYLVVGLFWLVLTLLFEFSFALLVMGHPMDALLKDYELFRGRLWLIVVTTTFFAPLLAAKMRKRI
jgi:TRAP-type mannitol/chloroaromatic compound transport system permease small subunit